MIPQKLTSKQFLLFASISVTGFIVIIGSLKALNWGIMHAVFVGFIYSEILSHAVKPFQTWYEIETKREEIIEAFESGDTATMLDKLEKDKFDNE